MRRLKMSVFGIFLVVGSIFLLSGCSNSPEAKLADLFEEGQSYNLSNSPLDEPTITIKKLSDGKIIASRIKEGISEELNYTVVENEGMYQYHIVNNEEKGMFEVLSGYSDTTDFKVFYDEDHEGYAFVPISKNYAKADSTLKEVRSIYEDDPHYFVSNNQE